jgi:hypothetical protein
MRGRPSKDQHVASARGRKPFSLKTPLALRSICQAPNDLPMRAYLALVLWTRPHDETVAVDAITTSATGTTCSITVRYEPNMTQWAGSLNHVPDCCFAVPASHLASIASLSCYARGVRLAHQRGSVWPMALASSELPRTAPRCMSTASPSPAAVRLTPFGAAHRCAV